MTWFQVRAFVRACVSMNSEKRKEGGAVSCSLGLFFFQGLRGPGDGFALLGFDERFRSLGRSLSSVRYDRRLSFFKETFLLCRKNARMPLFFFVC